MPPFFGGLIPYDAEANIAFDCPGHQGGQFYRKPPSGQLFFKHFGESIFRNDLCNADVRVGDLLIHEGPSAQAQRHAARVFGADKTYFVLNGTSTSNKVVTNVVLRRGDLVLFDHKRERPFRLACIQLATYDGTVYNVEKVLEQIGHLCDYVPVAALPDVVNRLANDISWTAGPTAFLRLFLRGPSHSRQEMRIADRTEKSMHASGRLR